MDEHAKQMRPRTLWLRGILLPMLIYFVVQNVLLAAAQVLEAQILKSTAGARTGGFLYSLSDLLLGYPENSAAIAKAVAVLAALLTILPAGRREISFREYHPVWDNRKTRLTGNRKDASCVENSSAVGIAQGTGVLSGSRELLWAAGTILAGLSVNLLFGTLGFLGGTSGGSVSVPLALLVYAVIVPIAEETLFRGILLNRFLTLFPLLQSALLSAFFFALFHGSLQTAVYGFAMGILFAYGYAGSGHFRVPVLSHALTNALVVLLSGGNLFAALCSPAWTAMCAAAAVLCLVFAVFHN